MKRLSNLLAALVFASLVIFMSCGGDGDGDPELTTAQEKSIQLTDGAWTVDAANVRFGTEISDFDWSGFSVTFNLASTGGTSGSYTSNVGSVTPTDTSGGGQDATALWAATGGSWTMGADGNSLTKDGVTLTISQLTDTNLTVTFTVTSPARTAGVFDAVWTFPFTR